MLTTDLIGWKVRLDSLPLPVCVCDSKWEIVFGNPEAAAYFDRTSAELLERQGLCEFWPEDRRAAVRNKLEALKTKSRGEPEELTFPPRKDGPGATPVKARVSPICEGDATYWQFAFDKVFPSDTSHSEQLDLLKTLPEPAFIWKLSDGTIQVWNPSAKDFYGYATNQVVGKCVHDALKTAPRAAVQAIENALQCEGYWAGELTRAGAAERAVTVDARMKVINRGQDLWVLEINHDITRRRETEQALQFHFQLNKSITDQTVDPIFVIDSNGDIIFANPAAERVFGWSAHELIGQSFHGVLHHSRPDGSPFPPDACPLLRAHVVSEMIRSMELVFFRRDGSPVYVSCSNSPVWLENRDSAAVLIVRDISQQKRMERALAESEERLRLAVQASNIGTWDLNLLSGAVKLDEACQAALGLETHGEQAMNSWLRNVHPDDRRFTRERIKSAIDPQGHGQFQVEFRTTSRTDREMRFVQVRGQAFFEEKKTGREAVRLVGTMQDVTERKRAEAGLVQANLDLQEFAYAAAHDLQEPLRNVVNLLGLYKRNLGGQVGPGADLVDASIEDAQRMHQMVKDLLSFADVHQSVEDAVGVIEAGPVLTEAIKNLSVLVQEAEATLLNDSLPAIRVRKTHLLQLFQNLLSNALKYRSPDRKCVVRIAARRRGGDWVFSVADNGIGFDPAYAQRIFGVFKRLHGRMEYPGSGIGLAICGRIVHSYGGRIWAEGEVGHGATFFFTFPVINHAG